MQLMPFDARKKNYGGNMKTIQDFINLPTDGI